MEIIATVEEVSNRILGGEDSQTEFKAPRVEGRSVVGEGASSESFAGEMVAFANGVGGAILVGVEDDRSLAGYGGRRRRGVGDWVVDVARNNVLPPLTPVLAQRPARGARRRLVRRGRTCRARLGRTSDHRWSVVPAGGTRQTRPRWVRDGAVAARA
ncbi:ATP-binding protein [Egibacter rhizosphaerae]|uniref:ATP-binding protein n=1 Tax=Egibacter rhizosphaerae TaxID=1670831 RepID=A0A411YCC0_9ACTN|nr:ATP-binding protein [Egibacter rhizosphaerae]